MRITIHGKNFKEDNSKIKLKFEKMFELLELKYQFLNSESNYAEISVEINKELTFFVKIHINLINLGQTINVSEKNANIFAAISESKNKIEKQLKKIKAELKRN